MRTALQHMKHIRTYYPSRGRLGVVVETPWGQATYEMDHDFKQEPDPLHLRADKVLWMVDKALEDLYGRRGK